MAKAARNYTQIALKYAHDAISGKILACQWVKKASSASLMTWRREERSGLALQVQSQIESEKRGKPEPGPRRRYAIFAESLSHIKGDWPVGTRSSSSRHGRFHSHDVFGWVHRKGYIDPGSGKDLSAKAFRTAYLEMGRKKREVGLFRRLSESI